MWPFSRLRKAIDPGKAHAFKLADDGAVKAMSSVGAASPGRTGVPPASQRGSDRCAVSGCGRRRDDEMHTTTD